MTAIINGVELPLDVDTGATVSIISQTTFNRLWDKNNAPKIRPSGARLRTYTGEAIKVVGELEVDVFLNKQKDSLNLLVVEGNGPSLLGRDWLKKVRFDWSQLYQFKATSDLNKVLGFYPPCFGMN